MNAATLINQTSQNVEWFTPTEIIEAARRTMGRIDLDPASNSLANLRVKAEVYYAKEHDGLSKSWLGCVWLNPPFSRIENPKWVDKLESEYEDIGNVHQACCITFACTSEAWFQPLLKRPQCFLSPRTNYYTPAGQKVAGVTKGSVVTYYGPNVDRFAEEFSKLGTIKIQYERTKI